MKNQRPKNLNLLTIRFPMPAIVSILHRISGVILFILIPLLLYYLQQSLFSQQSYDDLFESFGMKFVVWVFLSAFIFHFAAGIRHLLMDVNVGIEKKTGTLTAYFTLGVAGLLIVLSAVWLLF